MSGLKLEWLAGPVSTQEPYVVIRKVATGRFPQWSYQLDKTRAPGKSQTSWRVTFFDNSALARLVNRNGTGTSAMLIKDTTYQHAVAAANAHHTHPGLASM